MNKGIIAVAFCALLLVLAEYARTQEDSATMLHMHEHLDRLTAVKSSLLIGELGSARAPARWLAEHDMPDDIPPMYNTFVDAMRTHAEEVVAAGDVESAAKGMATIATDCASCHTAMQVNLRFGFDEEPPMWSDLESHMQRHLWAVDRLWEGLIGPSDASWARGIRMLAEAPLEGTENTWGEAPATGNVLATRVHELGVEAAAALTPEARSSVYGEIVGACAACHTETGGGPRSN